LLPVDLPRFPSQNLSYPGLELKMTLVSPGAADTATKYSRDVDARALSAFSFQHSAETSLQNAKKSRTKDLSSAAILPG
jgi:hypothetical protein